MELGTVQTGTGKVDPARKFKFTTADIVVFAITLNIFYNFVQYYCSKYEILNKTQLFIYSIYFAISKKANIIIIRQF